MIQKQDLIDIFKKETATTIKVLEAYPTAKGDFKPHERSSDAVKLISTFVFEMYLASAYFFGGEFSFDIFKTYKPASTEDAIADFKKEAESVLGRLETFPDADLESKVEFGGTTFTKSSFLMMMIFDQIHHRGQLTVYVRMAGGKVPSIYGPSADDASTNL